MRKKLIIVCTIILIFLFSGCGKNTEEFVTLSDEKNYTVNAYNMGYAVSDYVYVIRDNSGSKLDSGYLEQSEPHFEYINNNILKFYYSYGTNATISRFYDLQNSLISEEYQEVCYSDENYVIYPSFNENGKTYINVCKLFDSKTIVEKELDTDGVFITTFDVKVDNNVVTVKHAKGVNNETIVETFNLINK